MHVSMCGESSCACIQVGGVFVCMCPWGVVRIYSCGGVHVHGPVGGLCTYIHVCVYVGMPLWGGALPVGEVMCMCMWGELFYMQHSKLPPGYMPPGQNTASYLLRKSEGFRQLGRHSQDSDT